MFETLKKSKALGLGLTKNSKKYAITHNGNFQPFRKDHPSTKPVLYLLKPVTVIEETQQYNKIERKEIELRARTVVKSITPRSWYTSSEHRVETLHDKLLVLQEVYQDSFLLSYSSTKEINKYYHVNEDYLNRYAIVCTEKFQITIDSLKDSVTLSFHMLTKKLCGRDSEVIEIMCRLIDIFQNFEPLIVNQFAPGIIDTLKNFIMLQDTEMSYTTGREVVEEIGKYIKDVHETVLSFGEEVEDFETPMQLIEAKKLEEARIKKEEAEQKATKDRINKEKQNDFLEKLKARRELLKDFNEPLENVPVKLAKKNEELFKNFMHEQA